ncbi:MAG: nuclear transport factor 2 family protein [Bacteroidota bacterium]
MNPVETMNSFYQFIMDKNAKAISDSYVDSEELYVILEGPRLSNRGHKNISKGWADFCESGLTLESIKWIEGPFCEEHSTMAWVAGVVVLEIEVNGRRFSQTFRASFVLTAKENEWKIKHEHVSAALEDPYGIGDWLK